MKEKEYILEHLSDEQYEECYNDLRLAFSRALKNTLDAWVSKGLITEHESVSVMSDWCAGDILTNEAMIELLG